VTGALDRAHYSVAASRICSEPAENLGDRLQGIENDFLTKIVPMLYIQA
jgi:hypothetical protein